MNAKEIKKIIADHVFCADTDAHRVLGIGDAATAIEKHIATLEAANAELKRKGDKLAEALREMIPYISMLKSYCERGETINFDNDSDEATGVLLTELLNRAPLREWEQRKGNKGGAS